jgi:hypothetical protein
MRPLQKGLSLAAATEDIPRLTIRPNLTGMPCESPPAFYLYGVDFRQSSP